MVSVGNDAKAANFPVGVVENGEMCHPLMAPRSCLLTATARCRCLLPAEKKNLCRDTSRFGTRHRTSTRFARPPESTRDHSDMPKGNTDLYERPRALVVESLQPDRNLARPLTAQELSMVNSNAALRRAQPS